MNDATPPARARKKPSRASGASRQYGGLSTDERRAQRRLKLIEAGLAVFGTKGFAGSGVLDICRAAALTDRYFYESFATPAELFYAVYGHVIGKLQAVSMAAVMTAMQTTSPTGRPDPMAIAEATLEAFLKFLKDDPRGAKVILVEMRVVDAMTSARALEALQGFAGMIRGLVSMLYPDLATLGLDLDTIVEALGATNVALGQRWVRQGFRQNLDFALHHQMVVYRGLDAHYRELKAASRERALGDATASASAFPLVPVPEQAARSPAVRRPRDRRA